MEQFKKLEGILFKRDFDMLYNWYKDYFGKFSTETTFISLVGSIYSNLNLRGEQLASDFDNEEVIYFFETDEFEVDEVIKGVSDEVAEILADDECNKLGINLYKEVSPDEFTLDTETDAFDIFDGYYNQMEYTLTIIFRYKLKNK